MSANPWFLALPAGRQAVLREDKWMLADAAFAAGLAEGKAQSTMPLPEGEASVNDIDFDDNEPAAVPTVGDYQALQKQYDTLQTLYKNAQDQLKRRCDCSK